VVLLSPDKESETGTANGINLTVEERTLLHLLEFHRFHESFEVPEDVTQLGISRGINIHQKHVPRTIKKLMSKGYTQEKTSRITGLKQKRKAYFLSTSGMEEARKIKDFISGAVVTFVGSDEKKSDVSVCDIPGLLDGEIQLVQVISYLGEDGTFEEKRFYKQLEELSKEQESSELDTQKKYEIYRTALEEAWDDSVLTLDERAILEGLRIKLGISEKEHKKIEDEVLQLIELPSTNKEIYKVALLQAHADGMLSEDELLMLDKLRKSLNISESEHTKLTEDVLQIRERKGADF